MKRITTIALVMLAGLLTAGRIHAQSQEVRATVPFHFIVNGKQLPAGDYRLTEVSSHIVLIENRDGSASALTMVAVPSKTQKSSNELVFHRYGDRYFLSQIECGKAAVSGDIPRSKLEKQAEEQRASVEPEGTILLALGN